MLFLIGYFVRKKLFRRICYGLGICLLLIFSSPILYNAYARWWQPSPVLLPGNSGYCFGIVAGGFGSVDADGNGYFNSSSDRFLQTVKLFQTGDVKHILISGGNSKINDHSFGEAHWAKRQMIQFGIPDSVIFVEDASKGTAENASNSKRILDSLNASQPVVLITSAFHMPRARSLFEHAGLQIIPYPCNYTEGRGPLKLSGIIPSFQTLFGWSRYIKETAWWLIN